MGQSRPVQVIHVLTENSIEERVWRTMRLKKALFSGLFDSTADEVSFEKLGRSNMMKVVKEVMDEGPTPAAQRDARPEPEPVALEEDTVAHTSDRGESAVPDLGGGERPSASRAPGADSPPTEPPGRPAAPSSEPPNPLEDAVAGLFEAGLRFLEAFSSPRPAPVAAQATEQEPQQRKQSSSPSQGGLSGLVKVDPDTNGRVMAIPLPETVDAERIEQAVGGLLRRLSGSV